MTLPHPLHGKDPKLDDVSTILEDGPYTGEDLAVVRYDTGLNVLDYLRTLNYGRIKVLGKETESIQFGTTTDGLKCSEHKIGKDEPVISDLATWVSSIYFARFPGAYRKHLKSARRLIGEEYLIARTPFSNGIINRGNALRYHYDVGNFDGAYTAVYIAKGATASGGELVFPTLDLAVRPSTAGTIVVFNGFKLLHGVAPLEGLRYSVVFYTLRRFMECK